MRVPAADDLFRPTVVPDSPAQEEAEESAGPPPRDATAPPAQTHPAETHPAQAPPAEQPGPRKPSGRVRHDEKMTVYVTADELLDLEHARLTLRREHGLAVDRGRLVRQAVAIALADIDEHGADSMIVSRLRQT